jgi:hypothetical protein
MPLRSSEEAAFRQTGVDHRGRDQEYGYANAFRDGR